MACVMTVWFLLNPEWTGILNDEKSVPASQQLHLKAEPSWILGVSEDGNPTGMYYIVEGVPVWVSVEVGTFADVEQLKKHIESKTWSHHSFRSSCGAGELIND